MGFLGTLIASMAKEEMGKSLSDGFTQNFGMTPMGSPTQVSTAPVTDSPQLAYDTTGMGMGGQSQAGGQQGGFTSALANVGKSVMNEKPVDMSQTYAQAQPQQFTSALAQNNWRW